jgi:hypothetical protein
MQKTPSSCLISLARSARLIEKLVRQIELPNQKIPELNDTKKPEETMY